MLDLCVSSLTMDGHCLFLYDQDIQMFAHVLPGSSVPLYSGKKKTLENVNLIQHQMSGLSAKQVVVYRCSEVLIISTLEQKSDWKSASVSKYKNVGRDSMKKQVIQVVLYTTDSFCE